MTLKKCPVCKAKMMPFKPNSCVWSCANDCCGIEKSDQLGNRYTISFNNYFIDYNDLSEEIFIDGIEQDYTIVNHVNVNKINNLLHKMCIMDKYDINFKLLELYINSIIKKPMKEFEKSFIFKLKKLTAFI